MQWTIGITVFNIGCAKGEVDRISAVLGIIRVHRGDDLGYVIFRLRLFCLILDSAKGGEQEREQNDDECDNDEELDQGEARSGLVNC